MSDWICVKCGSDTEETDEIEIRYDDMELPSASGVRCPVCGREYLLSSFVVDELNASEEMLQGK